MKFKGTGVALVTPFDATGNIDEQGLKNLVRLQIEGGTDFLVVQGTTGETATLTKEEKAQVLAIVLDENKGKLPVVLGVGGNNTAEVVQLVKHWNTSKVDGYLSVSPYYNKPSQEGIFQHFSAIAAVSEKPIIVYNVPGRTGSNMSADTTLRLAELENIVAVKEASGNLEQVMEIIQHAPDGFGVLSGDDALTLPMIALGAHGVISVVANAFPEKFSHMIYASLALDIIKAREIHYDLLKVTHQFFAEGNPAGVKAALKVREICNDVLRLPLVNVSEGLFEAIKTETKRLVG